MTDQPLSPLPTSYARAVLRVLALVMLAVIMFVPVLLIWFMRLEKLRARVVCFYYKCCSFICGVRLTVEGNISKKRPLMLVANHSSYLDIFVLGALLPLSFTPKSEIRSWPIIGFFCVLADCVFVERKPADIQRAQAEMADKLSAGKVLVLFPEGTTGDGINVKPFKSGFLSLIEAHDLPLQPVTLAYTHIASQPLTPATRDKVAWIGEADLVTHLGRLLSFTYIQVTARFYPIEQMEDHDDRKALAKSCEVTIAAGLKQILEANHVTG